MRQMCVLQYLEKKGIKNLQREHFSFSTKVFIGDFLKPTGKMSENGEEKYARLTEKEMYDDIDKLRRENGWKPRRRGSKSTAKVATNSNDKNTSGGNSAAASSAAAAVAASNNAMHQKQSTSATSKAAAAAASQAANPLSTLAETLLAKMQAEMQLRPDQQDSLRLQQEALR